MTINIDFNSGDIPLASILASGTNMLLMAATSCSRVVIQSHSKAGTLAIMLTACDHRLISEKYEWIPNDKMPNDNGAGGNEANNQMNLPLDTRS